MPVENSAACYTSIPSMPFWGHVNPHEEAFSHAPLVRVSVKDNYHITWQGIYIYQYWTQIQRLIETSATQFQETFFYLIFQSKIETYCFTYACYVSEEPIQFYVGNCNWTTWWVREIAYTWVLNKNKQIQNVSLVNVCKPESSYCNLVADV